MSKCVWCGRDDIDGVREDGLCVFCHLARALDEGFTKERARAGWLRDKAIREKWEREDADGIQDRRAQEVYGHEGTCGREPGLEMRDG